MSTGAPPDKVEVEVCNPRIADKGGHVEYECIWILSQILPGTLTPTTLKWSVFRRYKEFAVVEAALRKQYGSAVTKLVFPPKQIFGTTEPQFIMERCRNLQDYLSNALKVCYGCTSFGVTHLESIALRNFMKYDERLSLAPLPPGILATVNNALGTNIQPVVTPSSSSSGSSSTSTPTKASSAVTPSKSSTSTSSSSSTSTPNNSSSNATASPSTASPSSSSSSATTSTAAANNASRAAAMRRLQSRSAIVNTITTSPQTAPVSTIQGPNLAALPSSLPSNATNQSKTMTAPSLTSSGTTVPSSSTSSSGPRPPTVSTTAPATTTVAATVPLPMSPTPAPTANMGPRPPGPPGPGPMGGPPRPPGGMPQPPSGPPKPPATIGAPVPDGAPDRSSLLSSIRGGAKLKKAVTNDRSGPKL